MKKWMISLIVCISVVFQPLRIQAEEVSYKSDYAYLFDLDTGQIVLSDEIDTPIYPASMTKMMTLLVAIEKVSDVTEKVTMTDEMLRGLDAANASQAGFKVGDQVPIIDLMYGVMLPSGADCTNALAIHIAGSIEGYVDLMNQKAQALGMTRTHFANVTGLHHFEHVTTLRDLGELLKAGFQNETWRTIFETPEHISQPVKSDEDGVYMLSTVFRYIEGYTNTTKYHIPIDGFLGGKSGYTTRAEYCLASVATIGGVTYGLITAHAFEDYGVPVHIMDAQTIYDYYRNAYHKEVFFEKGDTLTTIPVQYNFFSPRLEVTADETIAQIIKNDANTEIVWNIPKTLKAPIEENQEIGSLSIVSDGVEIGTFTMHASRAIGRNLLLYALDVMWQHKILVIGILVIALIFFVICRYRLRKLRRRRKRRMRR